MCPLGRSVVLHQLRGLVEVSLQGARLAEAVGDQGGDGQAGPLAWLYDGPDDKDISLEEYQQVMQVRQEMRALPDAMAGIMCP